MVRHRTKGRSKRVVGMEDGAPVAKIVVREPKCSADSEYRESRNSP
jgi:hypothetical protein